MKTLAALALVALAVSATAADNRPDWMKPQPTLLQRELRPRTAEELRSAAEFQHRVAEAQRAIDAAEQRDHLAEILATLQAIQAQGR